MTTAVSTAITSETPARTVAVSLDFPSGFVRINGSPSDITIGGQIFLGVGGLGAISVVEESAELRAYDLSVSLSGVPRDSVSIALNQEYQGRAGVVYEVLLDQATWLPLSDPLVVFRGRMDMLDIRMGETATVSVKLLNRLADWERPKVRRFTPEDQERLYPGDKGLAFVPATVEKELIWPNRSWWEADAKGKIK
ncbi:hypothetical protein CKO45_01190 [Paracraurococcus ruber]|uniref:Uncharacterized protein n=2 Tax=Paracraurococcus ruber TaxID=77675 RepID=A0ABS1CRN2_9PROT|nr:hypothetical protein [Paracraurococcus ruber]